MSDDQTLSHISTERMDRVRFFLLALVPISLGLLLFALGSTVNYRALFQETYLDSKEFGETLTSNLAETRNQSQRLRSSFDAIASALGNVPRDPTTEPAINQISQQLSNARTALDAIDKQTRDSAESVSNWAASLPAPETLTPSLHFGALTNGRFSFTTPAMAKTYPKKQRQIEHTAPVEKLTDKLSNTGPFLWFLLGIPLIFVGLGVCWMRSADHEIKAFGMCAVTGAFGFYTGAATAVLTSVS